MISGLVTEGELPENVNKSFVSWARCIVRALEKSEYLDTIKKVGFKDVGIVSQNTFYELGLGERLVGKITRVKVRACK